MRNEITSFRQGADESLQLITITIFYDVN